MEAQGEVKKPRYWIDQIQGSDAMSQFSGLLDMSFKVAAPGRFLDDFPIWDENLGPDPSRLVRLGVFHERKLVSCAGVRLADLKTPRGRLCVALIGAVATHPDWRAKGLASQLVAVALQWAAERSAALAAIARALASGTFKTNIGASFPLADIVAAHEAVEQGKVLGNVVVEIG